MWIEGELKSIHDGLPGRVAWIKGMAAFGTRFAAAEDRAC
jgi:hypothetical protein